MKNIILTSALTILIMGTAAGQSKAKLATPTPQQILWHDLELTMFVHLIPATWPAFDENGRRIPAERINPAQLDVHQWIDAAESFGARMIVFVAKHGEGFCWWQTETNEYSIKNSPYKDGKGDVLRELSEACRERGMKLGIYIAPTDLSQGAYRGGAGRTEDQAKQGAYNKILRKQWEEVLSGYGKIYEIWFDGSCIVPLDDIVQKYASDAIIFQSTMANIRWVGNERGFAPYPAWNSVKREDGLTGVATGADGDPDGDVWIPLEVDIPLKTHFWVWSPENEKNLKSLDELIEIYYKSVGRGTVLLINAAPDTTGLIPKADMELYRQFGDDLRSRFGKSIVETSGRGNVVELEIGELLEIDHVITMEDIAFGERVRSYVIEGSRGNEWFEIVRGISIGHKRIDRFEPVKVTKIRFRCLKSAAPPVLRKLAAYSVKDMKVYNELESTTDDYGNPWTKGESRKYETPVQIGKLVKFKQKDEYRVDLSKYIDEPGQYEVFIAGTADRLPKLPGTADVYLDGNKTPGICKINRNHYTMEINITAYPSMKEGSIATRFTLSDIAGDDNIYIRKVVFD